MTAQAAKNHGADVVYFAPTSINEATILCAEIVYAFTNIIMVAAAYNGLLTILISFNAMLTTQLHIKDKQSDDPQVKLKGFTLYNQLRNENYC
jgi:hypothetical protein